MIVKHWKDKLKLLSYFSFTHDYAEIYQQNGTRTSAWDYLLYSKAFISCSLYQEQCPCYGWLAICVLRAFREGLNCHLFYFLS